ASFNLVLFFQLVDDDLGCASYLVGDPDTGECVIVDPAYAIEPYLHEAERRHARIVRVLETHTHADHVSGHGRLALEHGVPVHVHPLAEPEFPFEPLQHDQVLNVGGVRIRVLHTPGHRPEHCAFLVDERILLTGDSLFVGDAARPDLAVDPREGAEGLFDSLRRLALFADDVAVYPGHVAGSLCGAAMKPDRSSTLAEERRTNPALAHEELEAFVSASVSVSTPRPPTTARVVALNRGPWIGAPPPLPQVTDCYEATVLDVRPADVHAAGHVRGAINVPLDASSFATRAGFVLDPDERIVLHASSRDEAERAARGLRAVGFLELAGYVTDVEADARTEPVAMDDLERLLHDGSVTVLDVREKDERDTGYIPGSIHMPYRLLRACGSDCVENGKPVVTICESGARAAIAASVLAAAGIDARPVLHGGINDWTGHTVEFRRCGSG
ncbi:MAG TPA: MBL fold metallo-hydrolase, partial [Gaiellaceae bacterium]|nr:MBL fold metallo-hydrolase [Gaiellaceae bacterium]